MKQTNIINFKNYRDSKKRPILQDKKLLSFYYFLKNDQSINIDLNKLHLQGYTRPSKQARSIIHALISDEEIDLKTNAIFNFLDDIKAYCHNDLNPKNVYKADYIILNIIRQLFDRKYSEKELNNKNQNDIQSTILWVDNNESLKKKLTLFYYAYVNTDLTICEKIASINEEGNNPYNVMENMRLLSYSFVNSLSKESYFKIINTAIKDSSIYPHLNEEFYYYAKEICEKKPDFFSNQYAFRPFFLKNTKDIIHIFETNQLVNMSDDELSYISRYEKEDLIKIKQLMDLKIPISKIDKLLCYPDIIRLGYQKVVIIKNTFSSKENNEQDRVLSKRNRSF